MDYSVVEKEICDHLNSFSDLTNVVDVSVYPESLTGMKDPYEKGCVYIILASDKYNANNSVSEISQPHAPTFALSIKSRFRSGEVGVYKIKKIIEDHLLGFRPSDCGAISIGSFDFQTYEKDVWEYVLLVSCTSLRSQMFKNTLPGSNITGSQEEVFYTPKEV